MTARDLRFGRFVLQPQERRLLADGQAAALGARAFDLLLLLADKRGQLVTKDEMFQRVWPGLVVEENNLQVQVSALRKLLGADAIATVPGHGYRFTLDVQEMAPAPAPRAGEGRRPAIAVLPLAQLGGDEQQEYFGDGIAEGVIASLARSRWLLVIARNSSFNYRGPQVPLERVARELGVNYVVSGSVQRSGERLRVSAQLAETTGGETIWGERWDRRIDDLFAVQDEISSTIASTIEPEFLRREEARASRADADTLAHWELLMRARWHFWRSTREHNQTARELAERALTIKPDDCASLALLAFTHLVDLWGGHTPDPKQSIAEANRLALQAVRHDERDPHAHFTLGTALSLTGQMDRAVAELREAIRLYPDFAAAQGELGRLLAFSGQTAEAVAALQRCVVCSPGDPHLSLWLRSRAIASFVDGEYEAAARHAADAVARRPDWFFNHYLLAACRAAAGDPPGAETAFAEARRLMPVYRMNTLRVGHPFTRPVDLERFVAALRQAGWQE